MKLALIGLPKSGKTTIFNALTRSEHNTDKYGQVATEANIGVVQVADERITRLSELYKPKKTIYATIEYHDYPGIFAKEGDTADNAMLSEIKSAEAFAIVLRGFADEELDSIYDSGDPLAQLTRLEEEMMLNDLIIAEKRLEKIELGYKRGIKTPAILSEDKALHEICAQLQNNLPLRSLQLSPDEEKAVRGFQFFSAKPLLILINCSEDNLRAWDEVLNKLHDRGYKAYTIAGKFEEELSKLDTEEAEMFMADMGMTESIRDRLTHWSYQLIGYISFFTVGADEVRAWTLESGANAVAAAGKIHSDLARGFIRAECFKYDDIMAHGSEKILKEKGLFKLEGKEYVVKDGDIISIRFNV
ncbi:MAG: YchF family ATPase [Candidatus Cloacimonetes bacterium]|nr:YchF family ATPase [Candidatus Cloacimonadota bacterium]